MAGHPQKTDSKEFEVANLERRADQRPDPLSEDFRRDDAVDITVRVWGTDRPGERSSVACPATWKTDSVFVYMIADLVSASRGSLAEELPHAMTAHFSNLAQALVAAKRIQTSILEFVACCPDQDFGAAIVIHPAVINYRTDSSKEREFVQRALEQASSGQILLAESICSELRSLPGVEFRSVEPLVSVPGESQAGLAEFIWTDAERAPGLRLSPDFSRGVSSPLVSGEEDQPPMGATRIVDSPLRNLDKLPTGAGELSVPRSGEFVLPDLWDRQGQQAGQVAATDAGRAVTTEFEDASRGNSLLEELEPAKRPIVTRTRVLLGLAAVVVVGALVAVFNRAPRATNLSAPGQAPAGQTTGSRSDVAEPVAPVEGTKPPQIPPVVDRKPQPVPKPPKSDGKGPVNPPPEVQKGQNQNVDGFFAKDIPRLLQMAQSAVGSGDYANAEREYTIILRLQPGNPDATQGLHKLSLIRDENNH
jgi:hypothetical protein